MYQPVVCVLQTNCQSNSYTGWKFISYTNLLALYGFIYSVWFLLTTFTFDVNYPLTFSVWSFPMHVCILFPLKYSFPEYTNIFLWDSSFSIFSFSHGFSEYLIICLVYFFFFFDHCIVCHSSIYHFWLLPLWYPQIVLCWQTYTVHNKN